MIRYSLICENEDEFEGWFASSADYDQQEARGQVECPICATTTVRKAPMAPAIAKRRGQDDPRKAMAKLARDVQAHIRDTFDYVGERFADEARAIHDGDAKDRPIWGEATKAEAERLSDDGIPVAPLPAPFAPVPPRKVN
jgi:hypothetical protein